jgi:hypothetical protein
MAEGRVVGGGVMVATIVVGWPLEPEKPEERHEVKAGQTLAEALMAISPDRWGGRSVEVFFGAVSPQAHLPIADAVNVVLEDGQLWHVAVLPGTGVEAAIVTSLVAAGVGATTATIIAYVAMTAISMAISFGISMLLAPGRQADRAVSPADQPTSLTSLSPPRNMMRAGSRIPEIYGRLRTWPDMLFPSWSEWEPRDNYILNNYGENQLATSVQTVTSVYCVGIGAFNVDQPYFGETPISTANGTMSVFGPGATLPPWIKLPRPVANLSRIEFPGGRSGADPWLPWVTIPGDAVSEIWFQMHMPQGLYIIHTSPKVNPAVNQLNNQLWFDFEMERMNEQGTIMETVVRREIFDGQTRNELRKTYKFDLTPGRWKVRVAQSSQWQLGRAEFTWIEKSYLEGILGFERMQNEHRTFDRETCIIVQASSAAGPATQNLENFNVVVHRRLPPLLDVSGNLGFAMATSRWADAVTHTLTDPATCSYELAQVDWASVIEVQNSLDAMGEGQFNGIFDRVMSADEQIVQLARKARALVFLSAGRVMFARDDRKPNVSALFNRRNRIVDAGTAGLGLRFPGPDEHDAVEIMWLDADNDYKQRTYTHPEGMTPRNPMRIDLLGATYWHEVWRRARYEYALLRYRRRTQPLRVTEEAQLLTLLDRVAVVEPWHEGVIGGEVLSSLGAGLFLLDRDVPYPVGSVMKIRLRSTDGRSTTMLDCVQRDPAWPANQVEIINAPSWVLVSNDDLQIGTLFNLSLTDALDKASHWLVSGVEVEESGVTLSLMEDDDRIYQEADDAVVPPAPPIMNTY